MKKLFVFVLMVAMVIACGPKEDPEIAVTGVSLSRSAVTLEVGGTSNLTATVQPSNATNKAVSWSTSNQSVATVKNGTVTAVAEGTATITATAGGKSATCSVTVNKKVVAITSVVLDKAEVELEPGGTVTLTASVKPDDATDKSVTWTTSDASIVTVENGTVTAVAEGSVTITAKAGDKEAICQVTVKKSEEERIKTALMKIYDAMDGPNWRITGKWDTSKGLYSWQGVDWNETTRELKLIFNGDFGLKGEFPDCFDELTSLVRFFVQDEPGVTGTLPPSFQKLKNLGELVINGTSMTSLPDIFSGMPLWSVFIGSNPMTGSLPESLGESDGYLGERSEGHYPSLRIENNDFTGDVPESWLRLSSRVIIYTHKLSGQIPDYFYTADDPGYWINSYINHGFVMGDDDYRKIYPFVVKDRDIPGFWPKREIKDLITGKPIPYDDIVSNNKATVMYRWGSWCPYSAALLPQLKRMHEKYHDAGLEVIMRPAWGDDKGENLFRDYIMDNGYDIWYNFSSKSADISFSEEAALGNGAMPFANVIDNKGNIIFSTSHDVSDPSRGRFNHIPFFDLIPFLEGIFGPLEDDEVYSSTDYSQDGNVKSLQTAKEGKGINIVFMGDAYTDKDIKDGSYINLMRSAMEEFFKIEPYKTFRDRFNVYAVNVVSKNGRTGEGYSTALGAKAVGTSISINTAGEDKSFEYALKVPGIKDKKNLLICVLVNSSSLRGITSMIESLQSGVAWCSSGSNVPEAFGALVRHEAGGHGFAFLGDEYSTSSGTPGKALIDEYNRLYSKYGWYSNLDFTNDPSKVKWNYFLTDERYKDQVGIFEGAGGPFSTGIYRPSEDSIMNHNVEYYNAPSRWAIYKRIMELSGEEASFEKFLEYDAVNRDKKQSSAPRTRSIVEWEPDAPPVVRP